MIKEQNGKKEKLEMNKPKEYEEIEAPFFRFENVGDSIEGILTDITPADNFNLYTLTQYNGDIVRFHGSTQLDELLRQIEDLPTHVKILFAETRPTPKGSDLKIFKLFKGTN